GVFFLLARLAIANAQSDITGSIEQRMKQWTLAVPQFHGSGGAEAVMSTFNASLRTQLTDTGVLSIVSESFYPLNVPQTLQDFRRPSPWLTEWSNPPVGATHLVFGNATVKDDGLVLFGWLLNLSQPDPVSAKVIGKVYFGSLDADGSKKVAREFAADILQSFNIKTLLGTKIYFVSDRTGAKEIWSMDS